MERISNNLFFLALSIFCLLYFTASFTQTLEPVFHRFTIQQGLPSSEVYTVIQDSKGYLWFGTDNGVCRYDGEKFSNYSTQDGLSDNVVFKIFEDSQGRIWFGTQSCKLSYYFNDSIFSFEHNKVLYDTLPKNPILTSFYVDKNNNVFLGLVSDGCFKISQKGKLEHFYPDLKNYLGWGTFYVLDFDSALVGFVSADIPESKTERIIFPSEGKILKSTFRLESKQITRSNVCTLKSKNGHRYISLSKSLISADKNFKESFFPFEKEILCLYEDHQNKIWIGLAKGGIRILGEKTNSFSFLQDLSVSSILNDHEGGFWFTTLEKGIYYIPNISIHEFSKESGYNNVACNAICSDNNGHIYAGLQNSNVCILSDDDYKLQSVSGIEFNHNPYVVLDLQFQSPSKLWVGTVGDIIKTVFNKITLNGLEIIPVSSPYLLLYQNSIWGGNSIGICKYNNQYLAYNTSLLLPHIRVNCLAPDTLNNFWIGSKNGLWKFQSEKFQYLGNTNPLLQFAINDIKKINNQLLLATEGAGLVVMKDDSIYNFNNQDGLIGENINSIYVDRDGLVWITTKQEIATIDFNNGNHKLITNVSEKYGLSGEEISEIILNKGDILIAEKNGLRIIKNYKEKKLAIEMPVYITNILVNHSDTLLREYYDLPYDKNSIGVNYQAISYKFNKQLSYKYRMIGLDSTWYSTPNPSVHYAALPPGNYQFEVTVAGFPDFVHKTASVKFFIHPPYYKTWWFISLVIIVSISLIAALIYLRIHQIVTKSRLLQELNNTQQKALSAQMNPHFIFNSLNSIHTYILQNKTEDSSKYLAKFARLMRMVLDNSMEHLITIKDEIKALELYLELEVMRFKGKISYAIEVDDSIIADEMKIPPLLLQPYVENAIWHGLMHKEENGSIRISLKKQDHQIICNIMDDGIGRAKSSEIKPDKEINRKSVGTSITEKRVSLINSVHNIKIGVTMNDLQDYKGNPSGTVVKIIFPVII